MPPIRTLLPLLVAICLPFRPAHAAWEPGGTRVADDAINGFKIAGDGPGGAYVLRASELAMQRPYYLHHVLADGTPHPAWPEFGLALPWLRWQGDALASDGAGGVVVVQHSPFMGTPLPLMWRYLADGTLAPGWPAGGYDFVYLTCAIVGDGAGGQFAFWSSADTLFGHHVEANGALDAAWPPRGRVLGTIAAGFSPRAIAVSGGAVVVWERDGFLWGLRVDDDGLPATGWTAGGQRVSTFESGQNAPSLTQVDADAYLVVWSDDRAGLRDVYAQRFDGAGAVAAGWSTGGEPVCLATGNQVDVAAVPDGAGGAYLAWTDFRTTEGALYAVRLAEDATVPSPWAVGGTELATDVLPAFPALVTDGSGGAYSAWRDAAGSIHAAHLGPGVFAPGWPMNPAGLGGHVWAGSSVMSLQLTATGNSSAIAAWHDADRPGGVYGQRLGLDHVVATTADLRVVAVEDGVVRLAWRVHETDAALEVGRRTPEVDWVRLGSVVPDGAGEVAFVDRDVVAGRRHEYALFERGEGLPIGATGWVDVPNTARLALEGLVPNPSRGALTVAFALPDARPASLEILDLAGRRVASREVGGVAGRRVVDLGENARVPAGLYFVRLVHGGESRTVRGVVAR